MSKQPEDSSQESVQAQVDVTEEVTNMFREAAEELGVSTGDAPKTSREVAARVETALSAEPATLDQIRDMLRNVEASNANDIFDILAMAMAAEALDPIVSRIRFRSDIRKMVTQLSSCTRALTSIAQSLGVTLDESPVAADPNFANWPEERMRVLVARVGAQIDALLEREVTAASRARDAEARAAMLEAKLTQQASSHQTLLTAREQFVEQHRQAALDANTLLATYSETSSFIVAQVDAVTGAPQLFLQLVTDDDGNETYKSTNEWRKATRFKTWTRAQNVRARLVKTLRKRRPASEHEQIGDTCVTLQVCLRRVTHEDFD